MTRRYPTRVGRPSKRAIATQLAYMAGDLAAMPEPKTRKTGPQKEGLVNKAIAAWRKLKPNMLLERNKRRLATPPGMSQPIMLGWQAEHSPDWVGDTSIVVTAAMVGHRISVATYIEAKAEGGVLSKSQEAFLNAAKDRGAIAGVAKSAADAEDIISRWMARHLQPTEGEGRG